MDTAKTSQQFIHQVGAALGVSPFVLAATAGGFCVGLLLMIGVSQRIRVDPDPACAQPARSRSAREMK
ncbi:MAG: hypothetical protein ACJ8NS_05765 [Chthoniobacterales bacterium]